MDRGTENESQDMRRRKALAVAEACARLLRENFGARRVIPFGSVVGQGPWHENSDLDLAVEGMAPEHFWEAWRALKQVVPPDLSVDLVLLEGAWPELRRRILEEVAMPQYSLEALKGLIEDELKGLERVVTAMDEDLTQRSNPPTPRELRSMSALLHEFYAAIESIFRRIATHMGEGLPRGSHWHLDLLEQMATARGGGRPAVIDEALWAMLKDYLDFRHFFRHAYGYELEWVRLRPPAEGMAGVLMQFQSQLEGFFQAMEGQKG
ncbi:MAG: nucleotidyltransferase domain-containing protein [Nitrospinae bacterium]|nr:nucleotidyltransferase domain-containing protein [Nitrospinota bacterium]